MASVIMSRSFIWTVFCTCLAICVASPTRRQFVSITETTSSDPAAVTNDASVWDDTDDFDLDGDQWMSNGKASPSSIPERREYEEYDDDDYPGDQDGKVLVDFGDDEDPVEHQDAEEEDSQNKHDSEFLFLPARDTRLLLEDDDDDSGPIKVRHTGRSSFSKGIDVDNPAEEEKEPFEFTIDEEDDDDVDDDEDSDKESDDPDDLVVEDTPDNHVSNIHDLSRHNSHDDDDDDDDDDEEEFAAEGDDESMFENPEEEAAQVIYGDHVFLY